MLPAEWNTRWVRWEDLQLSLHGGALRADYHGRVFFADHPATEILQAVGAFCSGRESSYSVFRLSDEPTACDTFLQNGIRGITIKLAFVLHDGVESEAKLDFYCAARDYELPDSCPSVKKERRAQRRPFTNVEAAKI